jgi:phytoene synthase
MAGLSESYAYAEALTRAGKTTFFHTFRFLTPERRRSIFAVYAYSRRLDDAVDRVTEEGAIDDTAATERAREELRFLSSFLEEDAPDDPLVPALRHTIEAFSIPRRHLEDLIRGMEMDLEVRRYPTFDDLYLYCYRAAAAVGLASIEIFGHDGEGTAEPAEALGIAMQLTNIVRDVAEDLRRGRIYLPLEDLARYSYGEDDLARGVVDERFRELMRFQVERARSYFERSDALFPRVRAESRYCPRLLRRFYSRILDVVERRGYDVLSRRPRLAAHEKLALFAKTWLEARWRRE